MKKKLFIIPLILSSLSLSGCFGLIPTPSGDPDASDTSSIDKSTNGRDRLSDKELTLVVGQSHTVTLFSKNDDGTEREFDNVSRYVVGSQLVVEDASIATVTSSGLITAVKIGQTKFLYYVGKNTTPLECIINVVEKEVKEISLKRFKRKSLKDVAYDTSSVVLNAKYQTGFIEAVKPTLIDDSLINTSIPGEYDLFVYYTYNGTTASASGKVKIVETESELVDNVELQRSIYDLQYNNNMAGLPLSGNLKTLVVPVKFSDSSNYITNFDNVREDIGYAFNGTKEQTGFESVKTYYEKESFGKVTLNSTISEWYDTGKLSSYYYDRNNEDELVKQIRDWYFAEHPEEDIKDYDVNGDGFFDGLYLIYGSPDYKTASLGSGASEMWMAIKGSSTIGSADVDNPSPNLYMWASYDTIYPSREIALARTEKSQFSEEAYAGHSISYELIHTHTLIHEVGHSFGLDDYYTYGGDTLYPTEGNMQSLTIMGHDPMSLMLYNWVKPIVPGDSMSIDINDFQSSHDLILLTPEWNDLDSPFDEYILLELYSPTGLNKYDAVEHPVSYGGEGIDTFNAVGIRIWHVDERLAIKTGKETTEHGDFMFDPRVDNVFEVADNTPAHNIEEFKNDFKLYLVRNDKEYDYSTASYMRKTDFFYEGDKFTIEDYASQFPNSGKLYNGKDLGWEVSIDSIYEVDSETETWGATLTLTKKS